MRSKVERERRWEKEAVEEEGAMGVIKFKFSDVGIRISSRYLQTRGICKHLTEAFVDAAYIHFIRLKGATAFTKSSASNS